MSELDIALELAKLHSIRGVEFVRQLKLIYKGKKAISVTRRFTENPLYMFLFRQKYMQ